MRAITGTMINTRLELLQENSTCSTSKCCISVICLFNLKENIYSIVSVQLVGMLLSYKYQKIYNNKKSCTWKYVPHSFQPYVRKLFHYVLAKLKRKKGHAICFTHFFSLFFLNLYPYFQNLVFKKHPPQL